MCVFTRACVCAYMGVCLNVGVYTHVFVSAWVCLNVCVYMRMCVPAWVCV